MNFEIDAWLPSQQDVLKKYGLSDNGRVQQVVDASFIHYMRLKMPEDSGTMIANTRHKEPGYVTVETPYAHYQNEGILYVNPEHNVPGFPLFNDGVIVDYIGYRGKRVPSDKELKHSNPNRGAHFVERTISENFEDILKEGQKELDRQ